MFKNVYQEISKDNLYIKSIKLSSPLQKYCYILKLLQLILWIKYKSIITRGKFINQSLIMKLLFQPEVPCSLFSFFFFFVCLIRHFEEIVYKVFKKAFFKRVLRLFKSLFHYPFLSIFLFWEDIKLIRVLLWAN